MYIKKIKSGYSLVEMIIYVTLLTLVSFIVVQTILSFTSSYSDMTLMRKIEHSGLSAMERMTYSIRRAAVVDSINSSFVTSPGVLMLTHNLTTTPVNTKFYIDNGILKMDIGGVYYGPLTTSDVFVTNFTVNKFDSSISSAIKIDITIQSTLGNTTKSKTYHSLVVLRGS